MKTAQPGKKSSLAFKLALFVLTSTSLIFTAAFLYNYLASRLIVLKEAESSVQNLCLASVNEAETLFQSIQETPRYMALQLENPQITRGGIQEMLHSFLTGNPNVYGSIIAFEPYAFDPALQYFAPYGDREDGRPHVVVLGSETYHYFHKDWYLIPKELGRPVWSEPYYDEGGGNILMTTYSVPFYRGKDSQRVFQGVVTADVSLEWLVNSLTYIAPFKTGYSSILSQNGLFLTHPDPKLIMRESIFSVAEARGDASLREIGQEMIRGIPGFVPIRNLIQEQPAWLYYAPIPSTGWTLCVVVPQEAVFLNLYALNQRVLMIGVGGFLLLFIVVILISGNIVRPIRTLAHSTTEIAKGNLDVTLPEVDSNDEVGELTRSFEDMRVALKEYINQITVTTAAKERIESELKVARNIQMNFLPKHFPPFPEKREFDIFAHLEPAKEVGGDLYDFFLLDDDHLFFSVGDVADKGVPAALFMAVTKTLMKGIAMQGLPINEILARVNEELARDNDTSMFVTVFCGILDCRSGRVAYSNAAHNPPVLIRNGRRPEWMKLPPGFLLGPLPGMTYTTVHVQLHPGDILLAYTDGVTEAMNAAKQLYSNDRLIQTLAGRPFPTIESVVEEVLRSVKDHAAGEPPSDDLTVLGLLFKG